MTRPARTVAGASLVRRALSGHAAIGLLAGALLYVIALTGSLAVVHDQWTRWERPDVAELTSLTPDAAQAALSAVGSGTPAVLTLQLPTPDFPRAVVTDDRGSRYVDAAGRPGAAKRDGWSEFVVALHETLHLPATWGMILVGALGVALAALALTGVLAHPRIVTEAFRLRSRHATQIARVDWHNRLGVWTLPFVLAVTLTGAFLGLSSVGTMLMARDAGGDVQRVYAPVFGPQPVADAAPAPLPDVAAALRTLARRIPAAAPTLVAVRGAGTRGQDVQIYATLPHRLIFGESYLFDAGGSWKGAAGLADGTLGQQFAASTYDLHFGNFGGPLVELAYVALGLALCAVTATGTSIWLHKRRVRGHDGDRTTACWTVVVWGTPLALLACLWLGMATDALDLGPVFWLAIAAGIVAALVRPRLVDARALRRILAIGMAATGIVHLVAARWIGVGPAALDAGCVAVAAVLWIAARQPRAAR